LANRFYRTGSPPPLNLQLRPGHPPGTGFSAYSPDVAGCVAVGDTEEETRRNFQEALAEHFMAMREIGEPIPEPHTSVDYVEVAA
jgi:predicted RNase H-like HicB family nuclease